MRRLAKRFPGLKREARTLLQRTRARAYRIRRRLRPSPKIAGSARARLGVYVAYFDAAEIYRLHLAAFRQTCSGAFNYYVMKNCTTALEAHRFDAIVSEFGFPRVFTPWPALVPFSHDESLQRMVDRTSDEIIVVCDVDAFPIAPGWDDFVVRELATKDAVGALVHIPERTGLRTILHPCFLAFRRSFLEAHKLDVLRRGDGDPCYRITEWLIENGRFHEGCVTPLLPTAHEMELFPGFTHPPCSDRGTSDTASAPPTGTWCCTSGSGGSSPAGGRSGGPTARSWSASSRWSTCWSRSDRSSAGRSPRRRRRHRPATGAPVGVSGAAEPPGTGGSRWAVARSRGIGQAVRCSFPVGPDRGESRSALAADRPAAATSAAPGARERPLRGGDRGERRVHGLRARPAALDPPTQPLVRRPPAAGVLEPPAAPLSPGNQERLRQAHPDTTFVEVDGAAYERYRPETPPRLMAALLTLEAFGIRDADRVVFLDADMVCLGDLTDLFTLDVDLAACLTGSSRAAKEARAGTFGRRLRINTGVLVIGRRYLNDATRRRLGRYASGQFADQDVVNRFLGGRSVYCLDHRFNYHAEFFWRGDETDVRLLHYAGTKPLDAPDLPRMRPWFAARERQRWGP